MHRLLHLHRPKWQSAGPLEGGEFDPDDLRVVTVCLRDVRVLTPATRETREQSIPVQLEHYAAATPDWWSLNREPTRALLEREHEPELRRLAGARLGASPASLAVSVQAVNEHRLDLACVTLDGVTTIQIPYGCRLEHPGQVRQWIVDAAARLA